MKLLLIDKDGTLTFPPSGHEFVQDPLDQALLPGVEQTIKRYIADGWHPIVISNQGGVAAGYKSIESAIAEVQYCLKLTGIEWALIAHSYEDQGYGECIKIDASDNGLQWEVMTNTHQRFRKPNPGMINYARRLFDAEREDCLMIGDRPEDEQAAVAAGVPFLWAKEWVTPGLKSR